MGTEDLEDGVGGYIGVKESATRNFLRGRGACGSGLGDVSLCLIEEKGSTY